MRAVEFSASGGPEVIRVLEVTDPEPRAGQVLIEVAAAGLNRADVMQRKGYYPPPEGASDIPGLEVSGQILEVADDVDPGLVGARVVALLAGGGYAERVVVDARHVLRIPEELSTVEAAGLIEVAATVYSNLRAEAHVSPGETVLVHGGAGGIGTFAVQYLRAIGAQSIATVGTSAKADFVRRLGADHVIIYHQEDFADLVREITRGRGADVILDVVGAKYLSNNVKSLAVDGRLVVIGLQGGTKAELDLGRLLGKRLRIIGTTLRSRDAEAKAQIVAGVQEEVWPLVASGQIGVHTDRQFPLDQAQAAHEYFDAGQHTGKVLLTM